MTREPIGFVPIFEPAPGTIVTQAFILCSVCRSAISTHGGPKREALCVPCTTAMIEAGREA